MSIGSITPASTLLASLASGETGAAQSQGTGALFTQLLAQELEQLTEQVASAAAVDGQPVGAAATSNGAGATPAHGAAIDTGVMPVTAAATTAAAASTTAAATAPATTDASLQASATSGPTTKPAGHWYEVSYVHGATPVSKGPTAAHFVKGTTGKLLLTARTTGLTQITVRLHGTVADPTAAAKATASVMAQIDALVADGQA